MTFTSTTHRTSDGYSRQRPDSSKRRWLVFDPDGRIIDHNASNTDQCNNAIRRDRRDRRQHSQYWLARLHRDDMTVERVARRDGGRVLVMRFTDEHENQLVGELDINPDGTWSARTIFTGRASTAP